MQLSNYQILKIYWSMDLDAINSATVVRLPAGVGVLSFRHRIQTGSKAQPAS
jgi:hypothetical protein